MARPALTHPPTLIRLTLCLYSGEDDDLLAWFDTLPERGRAQQVIQALRQGGVGRVDKVEEDEDETNAAALIGLML